MEYLDRIVLKVAPVILDEGVGGRCFDVAGKGIDLIQLLSSHWPINSHKFISLVFAHIYYPP